MRDEGRPSSSRSILRGGGNGGGGRGRHGARRIRSAGRKIGLLFRTPILRAGDRDRRRAGDGPRGANVNVNWSCQVTESQRVSSPMTLVPSSTFCAFCW